MFRTVQGLVSLLLTILGEAAAAVVLIATLPVVAVLVGTPCACVEAIV